MPTDGKDEQLTTIRSKSENASKIIGFVKSG